MFTFEAQRNKKNITPACRQAGICNRLFMSLNSIKFDPADIASLYKISLVEINTTQQVLIPPETISELVAKGWNYLCLLYTSDAADERSSVDLGGRRII